MFVKVKKCLSFLLTVFLLGNTVYAETTKKAPINISELKSQILWELNCKKPFCNFTKIQEMYEIILKERDDSFNRFKYSIILQHTAKTKLEINTASEIEKHALHQILYGCGRPYTIMADTAALISTMYGTNIHFPRNEQKAKHWLSISQYFEEYSLYKCPNKSLGKCWRPKKINERL